MKGRIAEYIRGNEVLSKLDFLTVYLTLVELVKDGHLEW